MEDVITVTDEETRRIITAVRTISDVDLGQYQDVILRHRIARFVVMQGYSSAQMLIDKLMTDRPLINIFLHKILIPTTEMFRDAELWTELEETIKQKLSEESFIKIWVPDIYGDDELNSLLVTLSRDNLLSKATIYATALTQAAIDDSRDSVLDQKKFETSEANFKRMDEKNTLIPFLVKQEKYYKVSPELLDKVIFMRHDLCNDAPPDNGFNLILYRNRALYYNQTARKTCLDKICQSLIPGGYLVIGAGESLDGIDQAPSMAQASKNENIYRKNNKI